VRIAIGVRDSGVGGLTVARELKKRLPLAQLLYFADTIHVPYGDKSVEQIQHFALSISGFLLEHGADALVFACNTTSAHALGLARERFPDVPIFGVIEPGAKMAAKVSCKVGVLATQATVSSGVYTRTLREMNPAIETCEVACPAFVPLVEGEQTNSREAREACRHYLAPLLRFGADTVILGCTHYPLLLPALREVAPQLRFVDPATALAQEVAERFPHLEPSEKADRFFVSGARLGVSNWIETLLDLPEPKLENGPVFDFHPTS
jgi:glutamate racemase